MPGTVLGSRSTVAGLMAFVFWFFFWGGGLSCLNLDITTAS